MSNAARWHSGVAVLSLAVIACWAPRATEAQALEMIRGQCELYSLKEAIGFPPVEVHRTSPEFFSVFADSDASEINGANPLGYSASTDIMQRTEVFADSIYFHERVDIQAYGWIQSAIGKSDGLILFRVPSGQRFEYHIGGTLWVMKLNVAAAVASASVSLSRVEPGRTTVLATESIQTAPDLPNEVRRTPKFSGILTSGDYVYEAHLSAEAPRFGGFPWGEVWLRFKVHNVPTSVEPVNWGAVKLLFR
jgi:hypothetical protein